MGNYENEYTTISIRVPKSLRNEYNKTKEIWKEFKDFFFEIAEHVSRNELNQLRADHPNIITIIEEILPE